MGIIDDIFRVIRKGPEMASEIDRLKINTKTVASGARDATFQFPCLISNTIPIDMASTIARTIEKSYVNFTQQWLSLNQTIDITMDRNIVQYLKRFHQNVSLESVMENLTVKENEVKTYMEKVESGEYSFYTTPDKKFGILFNTSDKVTRDLVESHKEFLKPFMSDFNLNKCTFTEAEGDEITSADLARSIMSGAQTKQDEELRDKRIKQTSMMKQSVISDSDVKKANDVMPYLIQARLMAVNDKNEFVQFMDFVLGVKVILHPINSDEIIENIQRVFKNQSPFFKFLRWTSGEISLIKNLILNVDDIKSDVINKSSGKSPWFNQLKRLKDKRFSVRDFTVPHAIIPNATLVLSQYEVDYLNNNFGIDLSRPAMARKVINSLFLMTFIILDDGTGTVDILYKDEGSFQTYALETLEREVAAIKNSANLGRELGKMLAH